MRRAESAAQGGISPTRRLFLTILVVCIVHLEHCSMKSKEPPKGKGGSSLRDPEKDLTPEQLAKIGAISIAFNYAEMNLERCLFYSLNLYGNLWVDVVKRVGQIERKVDLFKLSAAYADRIITKGYKLSNLTFKDALLGTIRAFNACTKYRNLIMHSTIYNAQPTIGKRFGYSGEEGAEHVIMTIEALERFYRETQAVREELAIIERLLSLIRPMVVDYSANGRPKLQPGPEVQECLETLRAHQTARQLLGPYPKFPDKL